MITPHTLLYAIMFHSCSLFHLIALTYILTLCVVRRLCPMPPNMLVPRSFLLFVINFISTSLSNNHYHHHQNFCIQEFGGVKDRCLLHNLDIESCICSSFSAAPLESQPQHNSSVRDRCPFDRDETHDISSRPKSKLVPRAPPRIRTKEEQIETRR